MTEQRSDGFAPAFPSRGIVLAGVCAAGKTTIQRGLATCGIPARAIAQEHSLVPRLYARFGGRPLVFLSAKWATVCGRRPRASGLAFYRIEQQRVADARQAAQLVVHTDDLNPAEVTAVICAWWDRWIGVADFWGEVPEAIRPRLRELAAEGMDPAEIGGMARAALSPSSPVSRFDRHFNPSL
ncbi:MAG: hypothetical protein M0Z53_06815 [Thermaerobacter sp.]|nr:hypothetical protein [Thermaerobacter sp.]